MCVCVAHSLIISINPNLSSSINTQMQHTQTLCRRTNTKESKRAPTCFYSQFGSFAKIHFVISSSHTVTHTVTNTAAVVSLHWSLGHLCVILIICLRYSNLCCSFYCFCNKNPECRFSIDTFCSVFIYFFFSRMFHILFWAEASRWADVSH